MSQPNLVKERRRERRVDARLQIELSLDPETGGETASTVNISANGVYFTTRRFIAPLSKLGLRLLLPDEESEQEQEAFDVEGVVVRVEPEEERDDVEEYDVACYFTECSPEFRERLGRYVQSQF